MLICTNRNRYSVGGIAQAVDAAIRLSAAASQTRRVCGRYRAVESRRRVASAGTKTRIAGAILPSAHNRALARLVCGSAISLRPVPGAVARESLSDAHHACYSGNPSGSDTLEVGGGSDHGGQERCNMRRINCRAQRLCGRKARERARSHC